MKIRMPLGEVASMLAYVMPNPTFNPDGAKARRRLTSRYVLESHMAR